MIGVEFFVLEDGALVANEIAPRVHNSGHWTEAACAVSQFEQHIRAIAGLPLGDTARHSDCVMENLIGDEVLRAPDAARRAEPRAAPLRQGRSAARPQDGAFHAAEAPVQQLVEEIPNAGCQRRKGRSRSEFAYTENDDLAPTSQVLPRGPQSP